MKRREESIIFALSLVILEADYIHYVCTVLKKKGSIEEFERKHVML